MSASLGRSAFKLGFEISPIILTGSSQITQFVPVGMVPIVSITEPANFLTGLLSNSDVTNLDNFFAHFRPIPGAQIINQAIAQYPFANQAIAANAVIQQPLAISMLMIAPAKGPLGFAMKLATMLALKAVLDTHNTTGGTYTVITAGAFYDSLLMTSMRDASDGRSKQPQVEWQLDFTRPLVSLQDATSVLSNLNSKIANGQPTDGSLSGGVQSAGNSLSGGVLQIPAGAGLAGTSVAPVTPLTIGQIPS